jgi:hypothetical protein
MPFLIRGSDLIEFFSETGVLVPNLAQEDLGVALDNILSPAWGPITRAKLSEALATTGFYVSAVQRTYATITTGEQHPPRYSPPLTPLQTATRPALSSKPTSCGTKSTGCTERCRSSTGS